MSGEKKYRHRLGVEALNDRLCLSASALAAALPEPDAAVCRATTVLAWARVSGPSPSPDDVVVDGRIITAENSDAAAGTIPVHGDIRIKKLNSGG